MTERDKSILLATVTDTNGNTFTDTCTVEVQCHIWQWLIIVLLTLPSGIITAGYLAVLGQENGSDKTELIHTPTRDRHQLSPKNFRTTGPYSPPDAASFAYAFSAAKYGDNSLSFH